MTYLSDLAEAKRRGRAWGCICGADNPDHYDACHDCQRPSWTCGTCSTVNPDAAYECRECGGTANADGPDAEVAAAGAPETNFEDWVALQIGPRKVGGRYRSGYSNEEYEVLAIDRGPRAAWPAWQITVRYTQNDRTVAHCTGWEPERDRIVAESPGA